MIDLLADTHTTVWFLFDQQRLSSKARAALVATTQGGGQVYVSAITVVEICYLIEKQRFPVTYGVDLLSAIQNPAMPLRLLSIDLAVANAVTQIPRQLVPDMPDRIIAATALVHGLPLVTRDQKLRSAPIATIW